jgi:hypothetical protein
MRCARSLCCARAASGHAAAAPPSSVMNSRRLMSDKGLPPCKGVTTSNRRTLLYAQPSRRVPRGQFYALPTAHRATPRMKNSGRGLTPPPLRQSHRPIASRSVRDRVRHPTPACCACRWPPHRRNARVRRAEKYAGRLPIADYACARRGTLRLRGLLLRSATACGSLAPLFGGGSQIRSYITLRWRWTKTTMRSNMSPVLERSGECPVGRSASIYSKAISPPAFR